MAYSQPELPKPCACALVQDKYLDVVKDCFQANSSMHKALKDAFESFCNKQVGTSSTPELMANFCDTLLRKGGGERLTDDELEATLDKVVKLLVYINDRDMFRCECPCASPVCTHLPSSCGCSRCCQVVSMIKAVPHSHHADPGVMGLYACSEFHRKKLARRLLSAGQVEQQEQTFLSRLKQQCGAQFTQKMEGMNNDLAIAREKQSEFQEWLNGKV